LNKCLGAPVPGLSPAQFLFKLKIVLERDTFNSTYLVQQPAWAVSAAMAAVRVTKLRLNCIVEKDE
jgi:hypothetical protein